MSILADIGVPTARQCLNLLAPAVSLALLWWLLRNADSLVARFLPSLEWQRQLGWLNIRAEKTAAATFRWIGYCFDALLAAALYEIVHGAALLSQIRQTHESVEVVRMISYLPVPVASAGFWLVYLGVHLLPKLRREYEQQELERFRAEQAERERELDEEEETRVSANLPIGLKVPYSARPPRRS